MTIDVEVISREIIKPASSIPDHLQHYKFSLLDQCVPSANCIPLIYFYSLDDHKLSNNEKFSHLKTSLSQVLNQYYPLTGVIKDDYILDCKNGGVLVQEAQVNCQLSEILRSSHPVVSHKIADALSLTTFIKKWADTACGNGENICPKFESATLFPPESDAIAPPPTRENVVLKRFVFSNSNISALKEKYVLTLGTEKTKTYPTRFEALTSFLFSRFVTSTKRSIGPTRSYLLLTPVNFRKRMDPPLSDDHFGNLSVPTGSIISSQNDTEEEVYNYSIVNKLKEAISIYDNNFIKNLNYEELINFHNKVLKDLTSDIGELVLFTCSSFSRFPIYEADFGWGRPTWVAYGGLLQKNITFFMDTRNGDGIEAWIHLAEEDMTIFESDEVLLTYASPTTCP